MTAIAIVAPRGAEVPEIRSRRRGLASAARGAVGVASRRRDSRPTGALGGVPCAARPSTGFRHLDGPCQCFFGGPPPSFPASKNPAPSA